MPQLAGNSKLDEFGQKETMYSAGYIKRLTDPDRVRRFKAIEPGKLGHWKTVPFTDTKKRVSRLNGNAHPAITRGSIGNGVFLNDAQHGRLFGGIVPVYRDRWHFPDTSRTDRIYPDFVCSMGLCIQPTGLIIRRTTVVRQDCIDQKARSRKNGQTRRYAPKLEMLHVCEQFHDLKPSKVTETGKASATRPLECAHTVKSW